jgi:hypothetical protein
MLLKNQALQGSLRGCKRETVGLVSLITHFDTRAVTLQALIVGTRLNLAGSDAGDIFLKTAFGGRLAVGVTHGVVQVPDRDGQCVTFML